MKLLHSFILLLFLSSTASLTFAGPSLLLAPLPLKKGNVKKTTDLIAQLQSLLEKEKWTVVGISETSSPKTLAKALEAATEEQFNFNNKRAIEIIIQALTQIEKEKPGLSDLQKMAEAQLFLAYCHKNEGKTDLMNRALNEAARFNPSLAPDEVLFPPSLIQAFETAKDRIWTQGHFGSLMIESSPSGAQVLMNGTFKGKTPLRIDRYPVGVHHLYVQSGSMAVYKKIEIAENNNNSLHLRLTTAKEKGTSPIRTKTFLPTDTKGQEKWLRQRAKEMHQTNAIGVGLVSKKSETIVVVISLKEKESTPFLFKMVESTSNQKLAENIMEKLGEK